MTINATAVEMVINFGNIDLERISAGHSQILHHIPRLSKGTPWNQDYKFIH